MAAIIERAPDVPLAATAIDPNLPAFDIAATSAGVETSAIAA